MPGKLNTFQKAMLLWKDFHPYNAVHVIRIVPALDPVKLREIVRNELERLGLTGLTLNRGNGTFAYSGSPSCAEITVVQSTGHSDSALSSEIEKQINTPFHEGPPCEPFRFFLLNSGEASFFGIVYFHCIAGADSIVLLMKSIFETCRGNDYHVFTAPLELYPKQYGLLRGFGLAQTLRSLSTLPTRIRAVRSCFRPWFRDVGDYNNGFSLFTLEPDQFRTLLRASKTLEITLNDLFLALFMKSLAPFAERRRKASRRKNITVSSIVNIRKDLGIDTRRTFGLFLGSFPVSHEVPEGISIRELSREINRQTRYMKRCRSALLSAAELGMALRLFPLLSLERRKKFFPKYYPLWGGITNMNLNTLWGQDGTDAINYTRGVSTGPVTPIVLSLTTTGDKVNIGISFRTVLFSRQDVLSIVSSFKEGIEELGTAV